MALEHQSLKLFPLYRSQLRSRVKRIEALLLENALQHQVYLWLWLKWSLVVLDLIRSWVLYTHSNAHIFNDIRIHYTYRDVVEFEKTWVWYQMWLLFHRFHLCIHEVLRAHRRLGQWIDMADLTGWRNDDYFTILTVSCHLRVNVVHDLLKQLVIIQELITSVLRVFESQVSRNNVLVAVTDERAKQYQSVRLLSFYIHHKVLESVIWELIVNCERPTSNHVLKGFAALVFLEDFDSLPVNMVREWRCDSWFPNSIDIKLLGVHESFSNHDLSFEQRILRDFTHIEP